MKSTLLTSINLLLICTLGLAAQPRYPEVRKAPAKVVHKGSANDPQKTVRKEIAGQWEHSLSAENVSSIDGLLGDDLRYLQVKVRLDLRSDGTYSFSLYSLEAGELVDEAGTWTITKDGSTLVMNKLDGEQQLIRIKYLELDELVLEQDLEFGDHEYNLPKSDYFFNKH